MNVYKIKFGNTSILFTGTDVQASELAEENSGTYTFYKESEDSTAAVKLDSQIEFGILLWKEFLIDNRKSSLSIDIQTSIELDNQFSLIERCCFRGDLKTLEYLILQIPVNGVVFTQNRKDKYYNMLQDFKLKQ